MNNDAQRLPSKAEQSIRAAESLIRDAHPAFEAARAYYAMFYTAEAMLCEEGLVFRKHAGVHAAFGEQFAKTELVDPKFHRWLLDAFDTRVQGDYGLDDDLTGGEADALIAQAAEFLAIARHYLGASP